MSFPVQSDKIVGGVAAGVGEFPFLVPLKSAGGFQFCGGSIVNEKFILTAAHCVDGDNSGLNIVAGDYCKNSDEEGEQKIDVVKVTLHPDWDTNTNVGDIALLELASPLDLSVANAGAIQLDTDGSCSQGTLTVAGWGTTSSGGSTSQYPQKVNVDYVSNADCEAQYGTGEITDGMMCAASPGSDSCQGDSGGPLFNMECGGQTKLVGVVSWGNGCALPDYAGVYTRVSVYVDWINDIIAGGTGAGC
ncbi:hypothetical protein BaRGS_00010920 [Batillaria attramentaria]|uniref:Peptidase S1 domain-containing protein n=1 Tax=Batillaria attramentaria TaxID=370345 RepID=A0ABD0LE81_9CAEN